jgi:similar to spore coat protein
MAGILQSLMGMGDITEQVIATDLLISAKAGVRNYAAAISEAVTPEVREVLRKHLETAVRSHEQVTEYMIKRGYYHVKDPAEQIEVDLKAANTALNIQ